MRSTGEPGRAVISPLRGYQRWLFLTGLLLLWPLLLHGDVFVFNDTIAYLRGADTLFGKLADYQNPFFAAGAPLAGPSGPGEVAEGARKLIPYGRSIYFGLFLYPGLILRMLWVPALMQALAAGAVIVAIVRHFVDPAEDRAFLRALLLALTVAVCTPLPFFVCFLMPDFAVGLALPVAALLLCGWRRERTAWRLGLFAIALYAALAHSSAVAVMAALGLGAIVVAMVRRSRAIAIPGLVVLAAALSGVAGEAAFGLATRLATGNHPVRPPFLTARLIEDGPGNRFLAEHCNGSGFVLCRYPIADRVTAEVFLWSTARPEGGFKALPVDEAIKVSQEQARFALTVMRTYPVETVAAFARDIVRLVGNLALDDFRPEFTAGRMRADGQFAAAPPGTPLPLANRIVSGLTLAMLLAALAGLVWIARSPGMARERRLVFVAAAAILLNDGICACLSGPFARYNTRVVWALPVMVLLFALAQRRAAGGHVSRYATTPRER